MDTSDSECFESADEEIYQDDDLPKKSIEKRNQLESEIQKELTNLNFEYCSNPTQYQKLETEMNINKAVNPNESHLETKTTKEKDNNLNLETEKNDEIKKEVSIIQVLDIENNTQSETLNSIVENNEHKKSESETKCIGATEILFDEPDTLKIKNSCSVDSEVAVTNIKVDVDSNKDVQNKNNESKELSHAEENMWEQDDWESVSYEKESDIPENKTSNRKLPQEISKPHTGNKELHTKNEDNMWDNDEWEPFEEVQPQKQEHSTEPSWSSWGNWGGMTSILSTATQGVSTFTQGLSSVLESSIGIPDPKELAKIDRQQENIVQDCYEEDSSNESNVGFGFGNISNLVSGVSQLTKFVENTGSKVITGGLDTLETIGKKTMEVLQEGDPGLKNKRDLLKFNKKKPILSQVLREAKEKAEVANKVSQQTHSKKKLNYETLFDDYHGLVHLEALEMLSKQCDNTLQTLCENSTGSELQDLLETMDQIKELCELPDEDDDETSNFNDIKEKLQTAIQEINVSITYSKLITVWEETETWLSNLKLEFCDEEEMYQEALKVLAQLTAIAVEQFHKCGELMLIKDHRSTVDEADSLVQLTMALTSLIGLTAAKFSEKLNAKSSHTGNKESINSLITNVFFEAGNSSSYIQDAFQLLVPVLQAGAMQSN